MSVARNQKDSIQPLLNEFIQAEAVRRGLDPKSLSQEDLRLLAIDLLQDLSRDIKGGKNKFIQLQESEQDR